MPPSQMLREVATTRTIGWGAAVMGGVAVAAFLLVGLVHIDDNYHVDHVAGAWMGLAAYATDTGVLYPPLYEDGFFGGTRYGPTGLELNAVAAAITGEYLVSGKALALLVMCGLLGLVYRIARDLGCQRATALAVVGAVIATFSAQFAGTSIYGDALAVALQLAGIAVIMRREDHAGTAVAGILCGVAVTAKISGLWGGGAVLIWLLIRRRRSIVPFVIASVTSALALFGLGALLSQGRMMENLVGLSGSGFSGIGDVLVTTPSKAVDLLAHNAIATTIMLPFALVSCAVSLWRRDAQIVDIAFVCASVITLVTLTDVGTGFNHLLDLAVLIPLVVAGALGRLGSSALNALLLTALVAAAALSLLDLRHDVKQAAMVLVSGNTPPHLVPPPLPGLTEPYLSEDPSLAVERGQRPVALDTFMLLRIMRSRPDLEQQLIERLDRQEFATIVLITDLNLEDPWWAESHLGLNVARSIDRNYLLTGKVQGPVFRYRVLEPRSG